MWSHSSLTTLKIRFVATPRWSYPAMHSTTPINLSLRHTSCRSSTQRSHPTTKCSITSTVLSALYRRDHITPHHHNCKEVVRGDVYHSSFFRDGHTTPLQPTIQSSDLKKIDGIVHRKKKKMHCAQISCFEPTSIIIFELVAPNKLELR